MIAAESRHEQRMVETMPSMVALCPYASRFPYEMWVLPRGHAPCFETASDDLLHEASRLVRRCLVRLWQASGEPAFNLVLHSAPFDTIPPDHYHWHIEILPRSTTPAGFEWGTGIHINPLRPEDAADMLRRTRTAS
jgi:UDPglucose--hexose-1-phosphate uridylyltransferase